MAALGKSEENLNNLLLKAEIQQYPCNKKFL
mgnify:CR=1 FL=1